MCRDDVKKIYFDFYTTLFRSVYSQLINGLETNRKKRELGIKNCRKIDIIRSN